MASKIRKFRPQKDGRATTFRKVSKSPVNYVVDNKKLSRNKKNISGRAKTELFPIDVSSF